MGVRRDPTQLMQIGFLLLLVISAAQVGWWMYDHVRYARSVAERFAVYDPSVVEDSEARVNRILWEGGFFLVVLIGGMTVLTRTLRHDAELRRRQQNFLAAVSHEFKSPLASIQLAAETLVMRAREDDSKRLGSRIIEDGERLLRMIDNLLETTRLEEGRQELSPRLTNLHDAANAAVAAIAERARLSGVAVTVTAPKDLALHVDPLVVETGLRNLLDNALKSCVAAKSKTITVEGARNAAGVALSVTDDGLGFLPTDAAMIFEKFQRLGDELKRATPGTGLGLYIVRRLVELSGGTVEARSDGVGRGATVTLRWPNAERKS
jgi:two-component system sensor histidine kinase KdpD